MNVHVTHQYLDDDDQDVLLNLDPTVDSWCCLSWETSKGNNIGRKTPTDLADEPHDGACRSSTPTPKKAVESPRRSGKRSSELCNTTTPTSPDIIKKFRASLGADEWSSPITVELVSPVPPPFPVSLAHRNETRPAPLVLPADDEKADRKSEASLASFLSDDSDHVIDVHDSRLAKTQRAALNAGRSTAIDWRYGQDDWLLGAVCDGVWFARGEVSFPARTHCDTHCHLRLRVCVRRAQLLSLSTVLSPTQKAS